MGAGAGFEPATFRLLSVGYDLTIHEFRRLTGRWRESGGDAKANGRTMLANNSCVPKL